MYAEWNHYTISLQKIWQDHSLGMCIHHNAFVLDHGKAFELNILIDEQVGLKFTQLPEDKVLFLGADFKMQIFNQVFFSSYFISDPYFFIACVASFVLLIQGCLLILYTVWLIFLYWIIKWRTGFLRHIDEHIGIDLV